MKSFKKFMAEGTDPLQDFKLALSDNLKIDKNSSCKIWEMCGKRDRFIHITDHKNFNNLVNPPKNMTISAMKYNKKLEGIRTQGTIRVVLDGDYDIWFPQDLYSARGADNQRWISINQSQGYFSEIFSPKLIKELRKSIKTLLTNTKWFKPFLKVSKFDKDMLSGSNGTFAVHTKEFNTVLNEMLNTTKNTYKLFDKLLKDILAVQTKVLDKYSDEVQSNLMSIFNKMKTGKYKDVVSSHENKVVANYNFDDKFDDEGPDVFNTDEALVKNVKIKHIYITMLALFDYADIKCGREPHGMYTEDWYQYDTVFNNIKNSGYKGKIFLTGMLDFTRKNKGLVTDMNDESFDCFWSYMKKTYGITNKGKYLTI